MNEENTDLEHAFFGNVQTILWNYLVKLKRFPVPANEKQGNPGPCAPAGAKAGQ
jgi:hypothetical protein